jgi:hypothetical protein
VWRVAFAAPVHVLDDHRLIHPEGEDAPIIGIGLTALLAMLQQKPLSR